MIYIGNSGGLESIVEDLLDLGIGLFVHVKNDDFFYTFYKPEPKEKWFRVLCSHNDDSSSVDFYSFHNGHEKEEYNLSSSTLDGWYDLCNDPNTKFWFE